MSSFGCKIPVTKHLPLPLTLTHTQKHHAQDPAPEIPYLTTLITRLCLPRTSGIFHPGVEEKAGGAWGGSTKIRHARTLLKPFTPPLLSIARRLECRAPGRWCRLCHPPCSSLPRTRTSPSALSNVSVIGAGRGAWMHVSHSRYPSHRPWFRPMAPGDLPSPPPPPPA